MGTTRKIALLAVMGIVSLWVTFDASHAGDRYVDKGDGTITDRKTKLVGLKNANCFGKKRWQAALTAVARLANGACGLSDGSSAEDWRLPNKERLPTLFDWAESGLFTGVQTHFYWSDTPYDESASPGWAWVIYLGNGFIGRDDGRNGNYLWPVRDKP